MYVRGWFKCLSLSIVVVVAVRTMRVVVKRREKGLDVNLTYLTYDVLSEFFVVAKNFYH